MGRVLATVVTVVACVAHAGDEATQKDLDALRGTWSVVQLTENGEKLPTEKLTPIEVSIIATKLAILDDGKFREEITLKLDASKKPKWVDFRYTKGPNTDKVELGIYLLEGDTLTICTNETKDGTRPGAFASAKENGCSVVVLKRKK